MPATPPGDDPNETMALVRGYLKGQNLEQIGRVDDAVELYEAAVEKSFDSTGPYDRLIHIYADSARHEDVIRVAESAIRNVHTHDAKRAWYERMRGAAQEALAKVPRAAPRKRG